MRDQSDQLSAHASLPNASRTWRTENVRHSREQVEYLVDTLPIVGAAILQTTPGHDHADVTAFRMVLGAINVVAFKSRDQCDRAKVSFSPTQKCLSG